MLCSVQANTCPETLIALEGSQDFKEGLVPHEGSTHRRGLVPSSSQGSDWLRQVEQGGSGNHWSPQPASGQGGDPLEISQICHFIIAIAHLRYSDVLKILDLHLAIGFPSNSVADPETLERGN